MCRVEANQHRRVDFRVLQAEIQLPCHKWSLWGQKSHAREVNAKTQRLISSYLQVELFLRYEQGKPYLLYTIQTLTSELRLTYRQSTGNANEQDSLLSLAHLQRTTCCGQNALTKHKTHTPGCPRPSSDWARPVWGRLLEPLGRKAELWGHEHKGKVTACNHRRKDKAHSCSSKMRSWTLKS